MRIIQLLPSLNRGDAVGNDAVAIHHMLRQAGYETKIYAEYFEAGIEQGIVESYRHLPTLNAEDILLYHFASESETMTSLLRNVSCRRILIYHNITPDSYFLPYDPALSAQLRSGREELSSMREFFCAAIARSFYSRDDLLQTGYTCPIAVLPILIPFDDYQRPAANEVLQKFDDNRTNLLYVARIAPNKKVEDVIRAYAQYKKTYDMQSRLFIVGNDTVLPSYTERLKRYIEKLGLSLESDILFSGRVPFSHILAYYRLADVYVCLSEHEGFCVPLAEAMSFHLPMVVLDAAAMAETLGDAGLLLPNADSRLVAAAIHMAVTNAELRAKMKEGAKQRLKDFSYETVRDEFLRLLGKIVVGDFSTMESAAPPTYGLADQVKALSSSVTGKKEKSLVDFESIPFSKSPSWKRRVKQKILKPGYQWLYQYAPTLANAIGMGISRIVGYDAKRFK